MNGERVGFSHVSIAAISEGYRIDSEGSAKFLVLGFLRDASASERYEVKNDFTLRSFSVEQIIDKSLMKVSGTVRGQVLTVAIETKGGKTEKSFKVKGPVYPQVVANFYPLLQGFSKGRKYKLQIFDVESVKVRDVTVKGIGVESRNGVETLHLRNDLYPFVDNDIWIDRNGNTLEESVRDGLIVTRAEKSELARHLLLEDAVAKRDLVLDFSLIRVGRDIPAPTELSNLVMELSGYPSAYPLPEGPGQVTERTAPDRIRLSLSAPLRQSLAGILSADDRVRYLADTPSLNSGHPDIAAKKQEILVGSINQLESVARLVRWVATRLDDSVFDSKTALEALKLGKGNCQSHSRLYVALARAAGIPSRLVSGLVYAPGKGFLYHSWAESYIDGWMAVDPTFAQIPADITHIRLVEGDEPDDFAPLAGIIGRLKGEIVSLTRTTASGINGSESQGMAKQ